MPVEKKQLLGNRVMILSASDPYSQENARRMWYELQVLGIQGFHCTMAQPYPTLKDIETSAALFQRTGSKSIISIGSGAVADLGKAIRMRVQAFSGKGGLAIPLLSAATTLSPVHSSSVCGVLHHEEDVLAFSQSHPPEVVAVDPSVVTFNPTFLAEVAQPYLLGSLFDVIFALSIFFTHIHSANNPRVEDITKDVMGFVQQKQPDAGLFVFQPSTGDEGFRSLAQTAYSIGQLKSATQQLMGGVAWVGIVDISSLLSSLNPNKRLHLPHSWETVMALRAVLTLAIEDDIDEFTPDDERAALALRAGLVTTSTLTGGDGNRADINTEVVKGWLQELDKACEAIDKKVAANPRSFDVTVLTGVSSSSDPVSPAGHLEKLILLDELAAQATGNNNNLGNTNWLRDTIDSNSSSDSSCTNSSGAAVSAPAIRASLLKSELMLKVAEATLEP